MWAKNMEDKVFAKNAFQTVILFPISLLQFHFFLSIYLFNHSIVWFLCFYCILIIHYHLLSWFCFLFFQFFYFSLSLLSLSLSLSLSLTHSLTHPLSFTFRLLTLLEFVFNGVTNLRVASFFSFSSSFSCFLNDAIRDGLW